MCLRDKNLLALFSLMSTLKLLLSETQSNFKTFSPRKGIEYLPRILMYVLTYVIRVYVYLAGFSKRWLPTISTVSGYNEGAPKNSGAYAAFSAGGAGGGGGGAL